MWRVFPALSRSILGLAESSVPSKAQCVSAPLYERWQRGQIIGAATGNRMTQTTGLFHPALVDNSSNRNLQLTRDLHDLAVTPEGDLPEQVDASLIEQHGFASSDAVNLRQVIGLSRSGVVDDSELSIHAVSAWQFRDNRRFHGCIRSVRFA